MYEHANNFIFCSKHVQIEFIWSGGAGSTLHLTSSALSPPVFQQQIVKSVDSPDRLAKKVEFIIEVIAWSLKVIHSPPSPFSRPVLKVTC